MADRLAMILAGGDPPVHETGLMCARNTAAHGWMTETKLHLCGPAEARIVDDFALRETLRTIVEEGMTPVTCNLRSDKHSIGEPLAELGCEMAYVGEPISRAIRDRYVPRVR
jgi:hypothetical protein